MKISDILVAVCCYQQWSQDSITNWEEGSCHSVLTDFIKIMFIPRRFY